MGETMKLTRDRIEEIAREVYRCDRFTPTDEVWCNLHWLTLFAEAVERETLTEKDREIERLNGIVQSQAFRKECAETPLMRDVLAQLSTSQAREREAVERAEAYPMVKHYAHQILDRIRWWGAQEDGIPEEVFPAYAGLKASLLQALTPEETAAIMTQADALATAQADLERAREEERERIVGIITDSHNQITWSIPLRDEGKSIHADPRFIRAALAPEQKG